jgi:uncharacterized protein with GYD domain
VEVLRPKDAAFALDGARRRDDVTMSAIAYSLGSAGNVRTETLRAFTRQETDTALNKMA